MDWIQVLLMYIGAIAVTYLVVKLYFWICDALNMDNAIIIAWDRLKSIVAK